MLRRVNFKSQRVFRVLLVLHLLENFHEILTLFRDRAFSVLRKFAKFSYFAQGGKFSLMGVLSLVEGFFLMGDSLRLLAQFFRRGLRA